VLMFYLWSFSDSCGFEFSEMTYWFLLVRQISAVLWRVRVTSVAGFRQRALILGGIPTVPKISATSSLGKPAKTTLPGALQ
jgi:hypothetical protein